MYALDAVVLSQIFSFVIFPIQCAGPQKQEVINGHSLTIVWQKIKVRDVFQSGNQGNFLV